jgi:hypothetical protein
MEMVCCYNPSGEQLKILVFPIKVNDRPDDDRYNDNSKTNNHLLFPIPVVKPYYNLLENEPSE